MTHRAAILFLLALLSLPARAAEVERRVSENPLESAPAQPPAEKKNELTKPPALLEFVEAPFPAEAEQARIEGSVGLIVDIDDKGAVTNIEVSEPAGHGFDEAAVEAVKKFKFSPAEIDNVPAPVRIGYRYNFVLKPLPPPVEAVEKKSVVNLRGQLLTRGTRAVIPHAVISIDEGGQGATADDAGRFEVADVSAGKHKVSVVAPGYEKYETEEEIAEGKATEVTYYVRKKIFSQYETVVKGQRERKDVARVELKQEEIRLIPGTNGDALRVVQNLPGVARAPYGFGILLVRGGRPNDTRAYLDGVWIPLLFHFGGLTSVFNSDLLSDIAFYPGNFGAHDGRATAGVVEAETRTPSKDNFHGYANLNVFDTSLLLEGPLSDEWNFAVSARRSYIDFVLKQVFEIAGQDQVTIISPRYYDYQAKLEYAPKKSIHRYRFLLFGSDDAATFVLDNPALIDPEGRNDFGFRIAFHRAMATVVSNFSDRLRHKATAAIGVDQVHTSLGSDIGSDVTSWALQARNALQLDLNKALTLEVGTDSYFAHTAYTLASPPIPLPNQVPDPIASRQIVSGGGALEIVEPAVYGEAIWKPFEGTKIVPGLRFDYERQLGYFTFDPRISLFQQVLPKTLVKGGVGIYQQPPDFRAGQWTPEVGNPFLGPERALQYMVGVEQRFTDAIGLDLQLYYKDLSQQLQLSSGVVTRDGKEVLEHWNNGGIARSYGAEILLRHDLTQNFFGWIAYSLSRSERKDVFSRNGDWRVNLLDQPHNLIVVASYKWPFDWITGARFRFTSGNPQTPIVSRVYDSDGDNFFPIPGQPGSTRGPPFVQLDLRIDRRWVFRDWSMNTYLDVQNVTNHVNVENVTYNYDFTKTKILQGLPILPTLGVKAEF